MLNCLLIDDEPLALDVLEKYIEDVPYLHIAGRAGNAFTAMEVLQKGSIDLIFLDIQMPKLSGTSLVKTLQHPPKIIFTTAYKEYAMDAFELDAVDYLLKPFSFERFLRAVNKMNYNKAADTALINDAPGAEANEGFLYFRMERKMVKIFMHEVTYIESLKDYTKIYRQDKQPIVVRKSISTLEEMLPRKLFVRVHRSFIVSLAHVTAFTSRDVEIGKLEIPVGRLFRKQLERLENFKTPGQRK